MQPISVGFLFWFAFLAIALILLAGAIWLTVPRWIALLMGVQDASQLQIEDSYRKALGQIIGFPLVVIGALGVSVAAIQALLTYQGSQEVAYQDQYRRGFDALGSTSMATRIGGLYTLKTLIDTDKNSSVVDENSGESRASILLRALSAFAVEQPAKIDEIVHADALTALQIVAFRASQKGVELDLRRGKFPGSILADDPAGHHALLSNSDFYEADLRGSGLYKSDFSTSNLRQVDLSGANLAGATLKQAGLSGARFCPGLNFAVPEMMHVYAVRTAATSALFDDSYGEATRFDGAVMDDTSFTKATLLLPSFASAFLYKAKFKGATLKSPNFSATDLKGASFEGTTFMKPQFSGAVLIDTNFRAASGLENDSLSNAVLCNVTMPTGDVIVGDCARAEHEREILRAILSPAVVCKSEVTPQ